MHDDPLVVACDRYLESKRCQLWGQFSISRVEDRWDAACWLAEQVRGVYGGVIDRAEAAFGADWPESLKRGAETSVDSG